MPKFRVYRVRDSRCEGRDRHVPKRIYCRHKDGTLCEFSRRQAARNFIRNRRGMGEHEIEEVGD